jgi:hypothetical protein
MFCQTRNQGFCLRANHMHVCWLRAESFACRPWGKKCEHLAKSTQMVTQLPSPLDSHGCPMRLNFQAITELNASLGESCRTYLRDPNPERILTSLPKAEINRLKPHLAPVTLKLREELLDGKSRYKNQR